MPTDRHFLIPWPTLELQIAYGRQHVGRLEKRGEFPLRVQLGPGRVAWWQDEIDRWLAARPRGAPARLPHLGRHRAPATPEPDPEDIDLLRRRAAEYGLDLVPRKPERGRGGSPP